MTEKDLHGYNKWLVEVWNPNQLYIPFIESAPNAYLNSIKDKMKIYKIECYWEMPLAQGSFKTREKAQEAIDNEEWEIYTECTLQQVQEDGMVSIIEMDLN